MAQLRTRDEDVLEWIEHELQLNQTRLVTDDEEEVDYNSFLRLAEGEDISSDEEEDESAVDVTAQNVGMVADANSSHSGEVIVFSDDEDDDDNTGDDNITAPVMAPVMAPVTAPTLVPLPLPQTAPVKDVPKPIVRKVVPVVSARDALRLNLRKKVLVAAGDNLCQQMKIISSKLNLRTQITEKCR